MTFRTKIEVFTDFTFVRSGPTCTAVARSLCVSWAFLFIKVIDCPIPPLLWCRCDVGVIISFTLKKIKNKVANILSHNRG